MVGYCVNLWKCFRVGVCLGRTAEGRQLLRDSLPPPRDTRGRRIARAAALMVLPTLERWSDRGIAWMYARPYRFPGRIRFGRVDRLAFIAFRVMRDLSGALRTKLAPPIDPAIIEQVVRGALELRLGLRADRN